MTGPKPVAAPAAEADGGGLRLDDVSVTYRTGLTAVEDASFAIPRGTITALVGVNGSGKSTLFKAIMGFVPLATGPGRDPRAAGARRRWPTTSSPTCRRPRRSTGPSRCWSRTW